MNMWLVRTKLFLETIFTNINVDDWRAHTRPSSRTTSRSRATRVAQSVFHGVLLDKCDFWYFMNFDFGTELESSHKDM